MVLAHVILILVLVLIKIVTIHVILIQLLISKCFAGEPVNGTRNELFPDILTELAVELDALLEVVVRGFLVLFVVLIIGWLRW